MKCLDVAVVDGRRQSVLVERATPAPAAGEVLVRVASSGVNRADLHQIAGHYPPPPGEPEILGLELSGTVEGSGERVCALVAGGAHAEYAAVPRGQLLPVPERLSLADAAAIPEAFLTAYLNLALEGGLARGGRALVHAGASGVGLAAIRTAAYLGASVAATTRSAAKLDAMRAAGAAVAIDSTAGSVAAAVEQAWGRDAVDVVLDPIGAATLADDLAVLRPEGRVVVIATMSGARAEVDLALLMRKSARLVGSMLRARPRAEKAQIVARFRADVWPGFESGALAPDLDARFPPERAAEAFDRVRENRNTGKVLIDWARG
ncbi:MAG TPA: NAD(P)H-quinone oxidoreductase [Thermoanaerobaculia bacterium]|nr:NAD(P)H-quinone oxidoreductase [Thermoanaerobaculia bacterium]